jgi:gliding motility-associated protein GldL
MSTENQGFMHNFFTVVMPKVYGFGAAVVIAGAMFKLLNWPGGALMLGLGLSTEALIFILSAFEPVAKEVDWARVYPELRDDYQGTLGFAASSRATAQPVESISEKLDEIFAKAKIDAALAERLGEGMQTLADSVTGIADISKAVQFTEKYTTNIQKAAESMESMYVAQGGLVNAMQKLDSFVDHAENFHQGIQELTQTLQRANSTYAVTLQQIHQDFENSQNIYTNLSQSMADMAQAKDETENFRQELAKLNEKLSSLNNVYGNMLMALKS